MYKSSSAVLKTTVVTALAICTLSANAQEKVLNLYSARHYQTDEALYANFSKSTGIKINRIELGDEPLLERLRAEGNKSPADVILLVDAARLWKAQSEGLFSPVQSKVLMDRIPVELRASDNSWFGFSSRARVIVYNKATIKVEDADTYEELADPKNKGKVCTRSGSHPYNLSLFGSMIERSGEANTQAWLKGIVDNQARSPKGGDTDQIKAVASGECGIALTNSYYWVRLLKSTKPEDREVVAKVGW
jgi:iron(III) transport system substrate-binding protein